MRDEEADMLKKAIKAAGLIAIHVNADVTLSDFPRKVGRPHPEIVRSRPRSADPPEED